MLIYVSHKDIKQGTREDYISCPVALALQRKLDKRVEVATTRFNVCYSHRVFDYTSYIFPYHVRKFINDFDKAGKVEPMMFSLDECVEC